MRRTVIASYSAVRPAQAIEPAWEHCKQVGDWSLDLGVRRDRPNSHARVVRTRVLKYANEIFSPRPVFLEFWSSRGEGARANCLAGVDISRAPF